RYPPPISTLFPYTTLFRSHQGEGLPLVDVKVDMVHSHELSVPGPEGDLEVLDFNELFFFSHWHDPPSSSCAGSGSSGDARSWAPDRKSTRLNSSHVSISYA